MSPDREHFPRFKREWAMLNSLAAFNACNGALLWRRELTPGFMIHRNTIVDTDDTDDTLFLADNDSCKLIDSRGMALKGQRIFLYSHKNFLSAVNTSDGSPAWKSSDPNLLKTIGEHDGAQNPRLGYSSTAYLKASDEILYFAGPQRTNLVAVSAADGSVLWDHPHGNFQLVIRDDPLYAMGRTDTSKKFDLRTGKILADLDCFRGNCTRATVTADAIFARGHSHAGTLRLSLADDQPHRIPAMRPGCQDGVIAANGQLYWGP